MFTRFKTWFLTKLASALFPQLKKELLLDSLFHERMVQYSSRLIAEHMQKHMQQYEHRHRKQRAREESQNEQTTAQPSKPRTYSSNRRNANPHRQA